MQRSLLGLPLAALMTLAPSASAGEPVILEAGPDWDLTVTGQLRPRVIVHSGGDFGGEDSEWREQVTQRARLGLGLEEASGLAFAFELQDVRIWGEETLRGDDRPDRSTTDFSADGLDVHQVFAVLPLVDALDLKLGRQEIVLDKARLVGNNGWAQRGRSFDGVRLSWATHDERIVLDALYAKVIEPGVSLDGSVPPGRDGDVDFGGVHASFEIYPGHDVSPLYLVNIEQAPDNVRHTGGATASGSFGGLAYRAELFYQWGHLGDATIGAYLAAIAAGYTFDLSLEPEIMAWAEVLSGDGRDEPTGTFETLYATNHPLYGEMDFFNNIPEDTRNLGLIDIGARIGSGVIDGVRVHVDGHYFRGVEAAPSFVTIAPSGVAETSPGGATFGFEIDAKVTFVASDYVEIDGLYGLFLPGEGMRYLREVPAGVELSAEHLAYITTNVHF